MFNRLISLVLVLLLASVPAYAEGKEKGKNPPAPVVTAKAVSGEVAPQSSYIGSVYFSEVSDVASEVGGKVVQVNIEEGDHIKKGDILIRLSQDFLVTEIRAARAALAEAKANYDLARRDSQRVTTLFKSGSVHEGEYDSKRFTATARESELASQQAKLQRLRVQAEKKTIRAPFDGVVLNRSVYLGEWMSKGGDVAKLAMDGSFDVVVNVPEDVLRAVKKGLEVDISVSGRNYKGTVFATIPRGDVASRTFPVKIRVKGGDELAQGMQAKVSLPSGLVSQTIVVPRDAIISSRGKNVIYAVLDGKAKPFPVNVVGYRGMNAGVRAEGLKAGMEIVTKGNERLRPGQPVVAQ